MIAAETKESSLASSVSYQRKSEYPLSMQPKLSLIKSYCPVFLKNLTGAVVQSYRNLRNTILTELR